jgi:hypothetical protein
MKLHVLATPLVAAGIAFTALAHAQQASTAPQTHKPQSGTDAKDQIRLTRVTPQYWRVTFHNPPFNLFGPNTIPQLNQVVTAIETDPQVRVVVSTATSLTSS